MDYCVRLWYHKLACTCWSINSTLIYSQRFNAHCTHTRVQGNHSNIPSKCPADLAHAAGLDRLCGESARGQHHARGGGVHLEEHRTLRKEGEVHRVGDRQVAQVGARGIVLEGTDLHLE